MSTATASPSIQSDLLKHYRSPETAYDELLAPDGTPRPHWAGMIKTLRGMGAEGVRQRVEAGRRLVEERGIQFLPPDAPAGSGAGLGSGSDSLAHFARRIGGDWNQA